VFQVDCHRNHRGPYTGAGELVRTIVPEAQELAADLIRRHALTLMSVSPEVADLVPIAADVKRSFRFSREGNSRLFTLRLAHGLVDFLLEYAARADKAPTSISFENVDAAEALDREFIAVLLRRAPAESVLVAVATRSDAIDEPLLSALRSHATLVKRAPSEPPVSDPGAFVSALSPDRRRSLAEAYVASDCTSDDPVARCAYELASPSLRAELHEERASFLQAQLSPSLALGAIPFHAERTATPGVDPFAAGAAYAMRMGYYEASLDLARRGLRFFEHAELGRNLLFSLLLLGRLDEVKRFCAEVEERASEPALRSHCAYAMGILHARLYPPDKRDYGAARTWVNEAIALSALLPPSDTKVVNDVFLQNTLALVEMRTGRHDRALELLSEGLVRLQTEAPSKYEVESVILLHNRARIHVAMGHPELALEDYGTLLRHEPSNSEGHLDRGIILQQLGRLEEALEDYDAAIAWSPPYDEAFFNRAQTLCALGRKEEALLDYRRVLALEPEHAAALVNRAGVLYEKREFGAAREDALRALASSPQHAKAWCMLGLLEMASEKWQEASLAFDRAIEYDHAETTAWINRATLSLRRGDAEGALRDLGEAIRRREDATAFYNRGRVLESLKRWREAMADYARAFELSAGNLDDAARRRDLCREALAGAGG
jgi:tetratricopeptide (TPR) repeat protein